MKHFAFSLLLVFASSTLYAQTYDVCVYGGTPSGMVAAVTAKQEGMSVVLIEPSRWLGGILSAGIKPKQDCPEPRSVGGLTKSRILKLGDSPPDFRNNSVEWMKDEGVPVLYEYRVAAVRKNDTIIESIRLEHAPPGPDAVPPPTTDPTKFHEIKAKVFIDASYDGDLMYLAKVSYAVGREPREKFDEAVTGVGPPTNWTPIDPYVEPGKPESGLLKFVDADHGKKIGDGDDYTQAYNYRFYVTTDPEKRIPFGVPKNYDPKDYELLGRYVSYLVETLGENPDRLLVKLAEIFPGWVDGREGQFNYKRESLFSISPLGVSRFYQDGNWTVKSRIWREHLEYLQGIHHFLSTDSRVPEAFRQKTAEYGLNKSLNEATAGWPTQLYVRISRRMQGEAVLDLHDVWNQRKHDDSVGLALYGVDTYPVRRYVAKDPETGNIGVATEGNMFVGGPRGTGLPYQIPFGAIVPKREECTNLCVPLCFSATYIAYASARMEPVFCLLGESSAVAAAMAIKSKRSVQDIDKAAYKKRLLERKQVLEWSPPEVRPPDWLKNAGPNLARSARAVVSSQFSPGREYAATNINDGNIDTGTNNGRWVSAREDKSPYAELRFEKPVTVNAFRIVGGKVENDQITDPNGDFQLLMEDESGKWTEIVRIADNEEIDVGERFPRVSSKAFRLNLTGRLVRLARLWEWELYDVKD